MATSRFPILWRAVRTRTGEPVCDFPTILPDTSFTHTISKYDTATAKFPIITGDPTTEPPREWMIGSKPIESSLIAIAVDPVTGHETPVWWGLINKRTRVAGSVAQLGLTTAEGYWQYRYIRDTLQYPQADRLQIGLDMINRYIVDGAGGRNGLPLRVVVDGVGQLTDGDYKDTDDKNLYSLFGDLGFEWTVSVESLPGGLYGLVATLSERLGTFVPADQSPDVTFDLPGNLAGAQVIEDYTAGKGANDVMAVSTGQGGERPQSDHQTDIPDWMPTVELRARAGDNITSRATLNAYGASVLAAMRNGSTAYALTIDPSRSPGYGTRWNIGDTVGFDLSGSEFPDNPTGHARAGGVAFGNGRFSPVIAVDDSEDDSGDD